MGSRNESPLLERESELDLLREVLGDARAGRGRAVVVEGSAGAGKSALVAAAREGAGRHGMRVVSASGSEFEREFAFGAIRQLFEPVLVAASVGERRRLLAGAAAPTEWLVAGDSSANGFGDRADGFAALNAIYWLVANLTCDQPLLVAVDDLHWVDASSVRSLSHLVRRVADLPVAMVVALRPAEPGAPSALLDELCSQPGVARVTPRALTQRAVAHVVRTRLASADDDLCAACHATSRGNPFYLQELLRTLEQDGGLAQPNAVAAVHRASAPALGQRVARRIERVSPHAFRLATAMAVLGDGGSLGHAAALADMEEATAAEIARELVRTEILAGADPFAFVHPLVRRSVYDELAVTERDGLHAAAAQLLGAAGASREAIAAHLAALRPAGSATVASALLDAAGAATARAAPEAAIRLLLRALEERAEKPPRAALLFELGKAEMALRDPAAFASLGQALDLEQVPAVRATIAATLVELLSHAGQWEASLELVETAMAQLDGDPAVTEVEAVRAVMMAHEPRLALRLDRERPRLEELARGDSWPASAIRVLLGAVEAYRGEHPARAADLIRRGLEGGVLSERGAGAWAAALALGGLVCIDDYEGALAATVEVDREGRRQGALIGMLSAPAFRGFVHARRGALAEAEAEFRAVLDLAVQSGMAMWLTTAFFVSSDAILERQSMDDVAAMVEATEIEDAFLDSASGAMLLGVRGRLRLLGGRREHAIADLRRSAEIYAALRMGPTHSSWRSALALALPADEREEARALVDDELSLARATGLPRPQGVALRAAGLLENGSEGIEVLRESVSCLERSECRLEHARSLVELGAALRRGQRRSDAREHLVAGLEMAHRCGATRLTGRAEEELWAAGARPRRLVQSGASALTASEQRVVRLAAEGRSNPEIAQELFVSLKTVETHLSHAYSKLGLSGQGARRGLADALSP